MLRSINELEFKYSGLFGGGGEDTEEQPRDESSEFRNYWGWYCLIDEITHGDALKEDEVYKWEVVRFLNRLCYIKDKNKMLDSIKIKEQLLNAK